MTTNNAWNTPELITSVGILTAGTWNATDIALAYGGTNASLTASNGGIFYSTASAGAILSGTATANQIVMSGASAAPSWSTATYPATTTVNQILYSSSSNTIAGLATANSSVLVTSSGGVPSLSTLLPTGVQTNITSLGTVTTGTYSAVMQDYTETNTASTQSSAYTINLNNGNVVSLTLTGTVTLSFSNVPASGAVSLTLFLIQDGTGSRTVSWPGSVIWSGGTAPTLTTTANHVDTIVMMTTNGGSTWRAFAAGLNFSS